MNYLDWRKRLQAGETIERTVHGNSMTPRLQSGDRVKIRPVTNAAEQLNLGDVVFCKVAGNFYCHLITGKKHEKDKGRWSFEISNNHGRVNGWTHLIYGKVDA